MSLKLQLLNKVRSEKRLFHKGELSDYARNLGYSSENAGRRLRELENEGLLKRKLNEKNMVLYYAITTPLVMPEKEISKKVAFGDTKLIYEMRWKGKRG